MTKWTGSTHNVQQRPWQVCSAQAGVAILKTLINRNNNIINRPIDYDLECYSPFGLVLDVWKWKQTRDSVHFRKKLLSSTISQLKSRLLHCTVTGNYLMVILALLNWMTFKKYVFEYSEMKTMDSIIEFRQEHKNNSQISKLNILIFFFCVAALHSTPAPAHFYSWRWTKGFRYLVW